MNLIKILKHLLHCVLLIDPSVYGITIKKFEIYIYIDFAEIDLIKHILDSKGVKLYSHFIEIVQNPMLITSVLTKTHV